MCAGACARARACVCSRVRVCVRARADPIVTMFAPGVECGFLRVYNDMYLNIVIIVTYFVGHVMLSFLINDFILYTAIVKRVVLIAVNALQIPPL